MLSKNYPKWQDLQPELLLVIVKRLTSIGDFVSFRGVCRSWRSVATFDNFDTELPRLPCLMYLAEKGEIGKKGEGKSVLDENEKGERKSIVDEKEVVEIWDNGEGKPIHKEVKIWDVDTNTRKITNFPSIYCIKSFPPLSCFGWTLYVSTESDNVSLRHFLLPISIKLPDMYLISKMVLSGSPMKSDCVVMVICGMDDGLAFCRPRDESWTYITTDVVDYHFFDIIYHNRKLYAVKYSGTEIYECDIHGSNPTKLVQVFAFGGVMRQLGNMRSSLRSYLVESRGKLLIVSRYDIYDKSDVRFRVFEIDLKGGSAQEISDLGDKSVFLGTNSSICVEIPESESLLVKPGRIYFTFTNTVWSDPREGVYRLRDGQFQNLVIFGFTISGVNLHNWVVPSI